MTSTAAAATARGASLVSASRSLWAAAPDWLECASSTMSAKLRWPRPSTAARMKPNFCSVVTTMGAPR